MPVHVVVAGATAELAFDQERAGCDRLDIPDAPARAFRDSSGQVHLIAGYQVNRQLIGPALGQVTRSCAVLYQGGRNDDPALYDDRSWLSAVYTVDGTTVHGLLSNEFHGHARPDLCSSRTYVDCWYNAVTAVVSDDSGFHFALAPMRHLVAGLPYRYRGDVGRRSGVFSPSNIVRWGDYFYAFVWAERTSAQRRGACLMRTSDLGDPGAWRAWDGSDFRVRFVDPYADTGARPEDHVCVPVPGVASTITSISRVDGSSTFVALMAAARPAVPGGEPVSGIYYASSADLLHWTQPRLLMAAPILFAFACSDRLVYAYPSLLDETSVSPTFETVGRSAFLFLTRIKTENCRLTMDRDLVRFAISLESGSIPAGQERQ